MKLNVDATGELAWMDHALCGRLRLEPEVFAGPRGPEDLELAQATCARCLVASECARHAERYESIGVWAGVLRG